MKLRQIVLLQENFNASLKFFKDGLGIKLNVCTERWAEFKIGDLNLSLKKVEKYKFILSKIRN